VDKSLQALAFAGSSCLIALDQALLSGEAESAPQCGLCHPRATTRKINIQRATSVYRGVSAFNRREGPLGGSG